MHNRDRMRISNRKVVNYLLKRGAKEIWLKPHTKRHDRIYTQDGRYTALDLFGLFDGIARMHDRLYFLQIKTNAWAKEQPLLNWLNLVKGVFILSINVKRNKEGSWSVHERTYYEGGKL